MELQGNGQRRWSFAQGPAPKKYLIRPMREESLNILQEGLHQGPHGFQVSSYPPEQTKKVVIKKDSPRQEETPGYSLQLPSLLESADQACCNMVSNVSAIHNSHSENDNLPIYVLLWPRMSDWSATPPAFKKES